ncbi:MAG: class I SAM-dependent methyltransferase [Balneolaceae bacterium]
MISDFFQSIRIKYADWPYILCLFLPVAVLSLLTVLLADPLTGLTVLVLLAFFTLLIYQTHLYRSIRRDLRDQQQKTQAYAMLLKLLDFEKPLPYMSDWASTPELSLAITDIITERKPRFIVELGGGISTLISAMNLVKTGQGRVLALDHDQSYARSSQQLLKKHNLDSVAAIRYAPLTSVHTDRGSWSWYDLADVPFGDTPIDLLIVDGPPVKTQKCARYPALPQLFGRLADDAVIVLHDTHRISESTFINWWEEEFPGLTVEKSDTEKGLAVISVNRRTSS